jgi:hypothetical protein
VRRQNEIGWLVVCLLHLMGEQSGAGQIMHSSAAKGTERRWKRKKGKDAGSQIKVTVVFVTILNGVSLAIARVLFAALAVKPSRYA